jgi:hypothetical protein
MNAARGEVALIVDGMPRRLCLTLGALAEIETAMGCRTLGDLEARMRHLSAGELMQLVTVLLRGGGEGTTAERVPELDIAPGAAARAVAEAFHAAMA